MREVGSLQQSSSSSSLVVVGATTEPSKPQHQERSSHRSSCGGGSLNGNINGNINGNGNININGSVALAPPDSGNSSSRHSYRSTGFHTPSQGGRRRLRPVEANPSSNHHHPALVPNSPFGPPFLSPPPQQQQRGSTSAGDGAKAGASDVAGFGFGVAFGSPFLSPPPRARPEPLVLDPSASGRRATATAMPVPQHHHRHHQQQQQQPYAGGGGAVQQLFQAAARGLVAAGPPTAAWGAQGGQQQQYHVHATPALGMAMGGAAAASAAGGRRPDVKAGFLQKLGANIPEFKRRFFVLRPEAALYYYLSPHDDEPRGRVDLEGARIEVVGGDAGGGGDAHDDSAPVDGGFRFAIVWDDDDGDHDDVTNGDENPSREEMDRWGVVRGDEDAKGGGGSYTNGSQSHPQQRQQQQQYLHYRPQRRIVLEARTREIGMEWIRRLREDRVSTLKGRVESLTNEGVAQRNRIMDLERQIEHFRMVERDRDGALEDARNWKDKFERLDEALRLLTQQIRKPPSVTSLSSTAAGAFARQGNGGTAVKQDASSGADEAVLTEEGTKEGTASAGEEDKKDDDDEDYSPKHIPAPAAAANISNSTDQNLNQSNRAHALLDVWTQDDNLDVEEILDVPGTYFSALSNACQQQRESLRLASVEASTAVEDVVEANERVDAVQKRMAKAEKHLLKLWEENCGIRKLMKQKKREKRVLVREVKQLHQTVNRLYEQGQSTPILPPSRNIDDDGQMADTMIGSDEERLIIELEEHVASSIRLHERLLGGKGFDHGKETDLNASMDASISTHPTSVTMEAVVDAEPEMKIRFDLTSASKLGNVGQGRKDVQSQEPKLLSLFDDDSESESSYDQKHGRKALEEGDYPPDELHSLAPSLSSTRAEMGDHDSAFAESIASIPHGTSMASVDTGGSSPERQNPIHKLDEDDDDDSCDDLRDDEKKETPIFSGTTFVKPSSKSMTENGQATSRLVCPLADVVATKVNSSAIDPEATSGLQVYHLTFYCQKIGIQFQKAPPSPTKPRGLLTDAMTADLVLETNGSDKTASELRSVASIASIAQGGTFGQGREFCPLALPEDIVLVCGFQGFDDSGTNQRPKLGARLVAFDGISVEVGRWTFDAIRKAIKARGRPLTLSFRNDFLTIEQRSILTKAVMDVDAKRPAPPPRPVIQYERPPSTTPSVNSALSHESDHFVNNFNDTRGNHIKQGINQYHHDRGALDDDAGLDISSKATADSNCWERCPPSVSSTTSSLSSTHRAGGDHHQHHALRRLSSTSLSTHKTTASNFRSFSDTGSSSHVISSALAPLMTNLLKGVSSSSDHGGRRDRVQHRRPRFEPDYLHREPTRLESTPQHQDFQSNLL